jgi:hypothetical protein
LRENWRNPNFRLPPAASLPQRPRNSLRYSAAGVIFAWHNEAHSKAIQPCQIIGRAFVNQHAVVNKFSRVKPDDTEFTGGGLRDFFRYRDLGISLKYSDWRVS